MRSDYGQRYRELYEHHWWWRARETVILRFLDDNEPPSGWKRILDVGCGDGLFFDQLARFGKVEGVEPIEELINKSGPARRIYVGPFDEKFEPGRKFSLILMLDVLEHLAEPCQAVRHALTLLKPEGRLLVTVPAFNLLWTNHDVLNEHFTRYTMSSFRRVANRAGLEIETERYLFQWLFPIKLAVRLAEQVLRLRPGPPEVPGRWINEVLFRLSCFERVLLGRLPVPFGTSLMVMGRNRSG